MSAMTRQAALDLLGIQEGADPKAIRAAWREMVRSYHPDQAKDDMAAANARLSEINAAYDLVTGTDPDEDPTDPEQSRTREVFRRPRAAQYCQRPHC